MQLKHLFFAGLTFLAIQVNAQNLGVNEDGSNPDPSAILDIKSNDKGILIPRVNINDVNSASPVTSPANGLLVFNEGGTETVGFYYWDGLASKWVLIGSGGSSSGPWDRTAPNVYLVEDGDSVGVGTNNPDAKLHVQSKSNNIPFIIEADNLQTNANPLLQLRDENGNPLVSFTSDDETNIFLGKNAGLNNAAIPNTTGVWNFFMGNNSGTANTSGYSNLGIGFESLMSNTTGYLNLGVGVDVLRANTTGTFNTAFGPGALRMNTVGTNNVALGSVALRNNTTANYNVAIGRNALYSQSFSNGGTAWDSENIAIGYDALYSNQPTSTSNGYRNVAIGNLALRANTTGYNNTAVGYQALYSNTTAIRNSAFGGFALANNTTGQQNTALGYLALAANQTGSYNVALGVDVLRAGTSGDYNIGIGNFALYYNAGGSSNVGIGYQTLYNNNFGGNNIAIGNSALRDNTNAHYNIAIGSGALVQQSFSNSSTSYNSENIAIGTNTLTVNNPTSTANGIRNIAIGGYSLDAATTGYYNTALGYGASGDLTDAIGNTSLGYSSGEVITTGDYNTSIGYNVDPDAATRTNTVMIGGNDALALGGNNRVRIGNNAMTSIGGQVGWTTISDARLKSNVNEDVVGLNFIMKLRPVTYNYKIEDYYKFYNKIDSTEDYEGKYNIENIRFSGFLAQEVEEAAKTSNYSFSGIDKPEDVNGAYGLRYSEFVVPMVKAMQEQQVMIDDLKTQVQKQQELLDQYKKLEKEMNQLKQEMDAIKK